MRGSHPHMRELEHTMVNAILKVAGPFPERELHKVQNGFEQLLNKKINFDVIVDDSLIGGFAAFIDGKVYDASVLAQLKDMRRSFK